MSNERLAALAVSCFRDEPRPTFRCQQNGPPVSAFDYVICRFQQSSSISQSDVVELNKVTQARFETAATTLSLILESMLDDIETTPLTSMSDISARWGHQLLEFNLPGLPVHQFVMQTLASCFTKAQHVIDRESRNASTQNR